MKSVIACLFLLLCAARVGQAQTITTQFTLGNATANCIPVTTQDGVPVAAGAGALCPQGFFGGGSMQVTLPNDPAFPGQSLTMYICSTSFVSSTIPGVSATQQAPGSYVQALSCLANYGYYTAQWDGFLTYDYSSVRQRRCTSGRGQTCRTLYYPVMSGGRSLIHTATAAPATTASAADGRRREYLGRFLRCRARVHIDSCDDRRAHLCGVGSVWFYPDCHQRRWLREHIPSRSVSDLRYRR
jgi:hypothetical protein